MSNTIEVIKTQTSIKLQKLCDLIEYMQPNDFFEAIEIFWNLHIFNYNKNVINEQCLAIAYQIAINKLLSIPLTQIEAFHNHFYRFPKYANKKPDINFINVFQMGFKDYSEYEPLNSNNNNNDNNINNNIDNNMKDIHEQIKKRRNKLKIYQDSD